MPTVHLGVQRSAFQRSRAALHCTKSLPASRKLPAACGKREKPGLAPRAATDWERLTRGYEYLLLASTTM